MLLSRTFYVLSVLIFMVSFLSCERIFKKVEDRINEKIDKSVDESLNKIDTLLKKGKLDSIKLNIDSSLTKTKVKINKK